MSSLKEVYSQYFQKSKTFLYPVLGIERYKSISLIETYLGIKDLITPQDKKLIALFYYRTDAEFKEFERTYLLNNPLFHSMHVLEDYRAVYIFDFDKPGYSENYQAVVDGCYTCLDLEHKSILLKFYEGNGTHRLYVDSFLFPSFYYEQYAEILTTHKSDVRSMTNLLSQVKQLCSKPDMTKETLELNLKNFDLNSNSLSLSVNQH